MSLHDIANHLAARGRNGDSTLVHMTPGEVQGLQALAATQGGSLTVNPDTGLPEANILKSLLPALAGVALTSVGLSPLMAAGLVGGGTALATRNLGQGLMAGLGAFGGAGLGTALAGLGATAAGRPPAGMPMAEVVDAAAGTGGRGAVAAAPAAPTLANMRGGLEQLFRDPSTATAQMGGARPLMRSGLMALAPVMTAEQPAAFPQTVTQQPQMQPSPYRMDRRVSPEAAAAPITSSRERNWFESRYTPPGMAQGGVPPVEDDPYFTMTGDSADAFRYLMGQGAAPRQEAPPPRTGGMVTFSPATMREDTGVSMIAPPTAPRPDSLAMTFDPELRNPLLPTVPVEATGAAGAPGAAGLPGGLQLMPRPAPPPELSLETRPWWLDDGSGGGAGGYRAGGHLLDGPGDGVSDSISGTIDGKRPVRVATGEFIFDARTVSEIGNGDTKAGAKKLYAVMDAIHNRRRTAERGEPSGADRELRKLLA